MFNTSKMLRKDIDIDINKDEIYLIPSISIGFGCKMLDISFRFLIFYIYIFYSIYDYKEDD